ncbi:MAG: DoxX family protein [Rhodovibrionaceae bacterium]
MSDSTVNINVRARGALSALASSFEPLRAALDGYARPVVLLLARVWMAKVFFDSGWARVQNWGSQEFLFSSIHPVPFLPASLAAPLTTGAELVLPLLLTLGLLSRLSATGLLIMTMTIQWIVGATPQGIENGIANPVHYLWMLILALLIVVGPGKLSLDRVFFRGGR